MSRSCPRCDNPLVPGATRCGKCGMVFSAPRGDPHVGRTVGNLKLVARLGRGGMGSVYRAEHVALGTHYAVKVLHPQFSHDEVLAERFRREAVACSRLRHENIVFVTDFGVHEEVGIYLVMEYLEGATLHAVLKHERRLRLARFARMASQLCDAIAAAHRIGIVHRDLKPDNVMVLDDPVAGERVKVFDFGIAHLRDAGRNTGLTAVGSIVGTAAYISPEQVDRTLGEVGPRSDLFSLGVIFYECLTGHLPFGEAGDLAQIMARVHRTPDAVSEHRPELARTHLEALIAAMLAKKPDERVESVDAAREFLLDAMDDLQDRGLVEGVELPRALRTIPPVASAPTLVSGSPTASVAPASVPPPEPTPEPARTTSPSLHITGVLQRIRAESPDSPAALLLAALPEADAMRGEALTFAVWGVLQQEILDAPTEEPKFQQSVGHLALLVGAVLDAHPGPAPTASQSKLFRSLKNLLTLASPDRQRAVIDALTPLMGNPLFPHEALPKTTSPGRAGSTWGAVRRVMTSEINLWPSKARESVAPPTTTDGRASQPPMSAPPPAPEPAPPEPTGGDSLADKLKKPMTVESIKSVLSHEITLFGPKKK